MQTIQAIFENGIFHSTDPVELPDRCEVALPIHPPPTASERTMLLRRVTIGRRFPFNPDLLDDLTEQHDITFTVYPNNHDFRGRRFFTGRVESA